MRVLVRNRMDDWPDDATVPSFGLRMRCSRCGKLGATAVPNWIERADRLPGRLPAMTSPAARRLWVATCGATAAAAVGMAGESEFGLPKFGEGARTI